MLDGNCRGRIRICFFIFKLAFALSVIFKYEPVYAISLVVIIETFASSKISKYGEVPLNQKVESPVEL